MQKKNVAQSSKSKINKKKKKSSKSEKNIETNDSKNLEVIYGRDSNTSTDKIPASESVQSVKKSSQNDDSLCCDSDKPVQSEIAPFIIKKQCQPICLKHFTNLMSKLEDKNMHEQQKGLCDKLACERDYYKQEYYRLTGICKRLQENGQRPPGAGCNACGILKEENLTSPRPNVSGADGKCNRTNCKRLERECDLLRCDVQRLEEECDCLRERFAALNENKMRDNAKFQETNLQNENLIRKLENERRELMTAQGARRATLNSLEEKADMYQELLRNANEELNRQKSMYFQLKYLHEQTDKALLDTQSQLAQAEGELNEYHKRFGNNKRPFESSLSTEGNKNQEELMEFLNSKERVIANLTEKLNAKDAIIQDKNRELEERSRQLEKARRQSESLQSRKSSKEAERRSKVFKTKALQTEIEQLSKENMSLQTSYHQMKNVSTQNQQQVSVALEAVGTLEDRAEELVKTNSALELRVADLTNRLVQCEEALAKKDAEVQCLNRSVRNLKTENEKISSERDEISEQLNSSASKLSAIQTENRNARAEKSEQADLLIKYKERIAVLENKLFKCICDICDNVKDKCYLGECVTNGTCQDFLDPKNKSSSQLKNVMTFIKEPKSDKKKDKPSEQNLEEYESLTDQIMGPHMFDKGVPQILTCMPQVPAIGGPTVSTEIENIFIESGRFADLDTSSSFQQLLNSSINSMNAKTEMSKCKVGKDVATNVPSQTYHREYLEHLYPADNSC